MEFLVTTLSCNETFWELCQYFLLELHLSDAVGVVKLLCSSFLDALAVVICFADMATAGAGTPLY